MEKPRTQALIGYDTAIKRYTDIHEGRTGTKRGAVLAIARAIGVSRQTIDNWGERSGFPDQYIPAIADLTGLPQKVIRPKTYLAEISCAAWDRGDPQEIVNETTILLKTRRK